MSRLGLIARPVALAALFVSGAVHGVVLAGFPAAEPEPSPGGGAAQAEVPLLGSDFADLAAGSVVPVAAASAALTPVAPAAALPLAAPAPPEVSVPVAAAQSVQALPEKLPEPAAKSAPTPKAAEKRAEKKAAPKPATAKPEKPAPRGNADRDARKGAASGTESGKGAVAKGAGGGGAGATLSPARYGAAVIQRIRKTPQKRGSGRGTARVGFEIGASGGLAAVRILRSSGSATLDAAALDHIRRAAPFPPPPEGRATFSFDFTARG
ncbi:MAG: TonB family protein [Paenirhodobacter sp.]|uniref:energy transducer TonB family protein n=1 Tax=Paenirhodobacter sp. TaxID=1965326 RepID=UPI003D114F6F